MRPLLLLSALTVFTIGSAQGGTLKQEEINRARANATKSAQKLGIKVDVSKEKVEMLEGELYIMGSVGFTMYRDGTFKSLRMTALETARGKSKPTTKAFDEKTMLQKGKEAIQKLWNVKDLTSPRISYVKSAGPMVNGFAGRFTSPSRKKNYTFMFAAESGKLLSISESAVKPN